MMHPKERYEEIITGKLTALPLPDMADAIWLRIERQLDIDLPSDEGGNMPEPPSPWSGGGLAVGAGLLAVVGALIAFLYLQPVSNKITNNTPANTPANIQVATPTINNDIPSNQSALMKPVNGPPAANTGKPQTAAPETAIADVTIAPTPNGDSSFTPAENLTAQATTNVPAALPEVKQDTVPKKRRGLQNISDKDYRIVPKNGDAP
ncbi:hypothetical protein [Paracnuella aquatica]|uniref:hypothetical protein n=1 Tax=Paracnuella aquatica TaxID=2268757 RepID=UPI000F502A52|nr:hypothetical protein [Paracnuella aquatica]RPD43875.1 hypothetical protein DRJ53_19020 [Paracnuella aquatica]